MRRYPPDMDFYDCEECGRVLAVPEDGSPCRFCGGSGSYDDERDHGYDDGCYGIHFADPGGVSALRAATTSNPRNLPCPTCGTPDVLTPADRGRGYQCDACANQAERGW